MTQLNDMQVLEDGDVQILEDGDGHKTPDPTFLQKLGAGLSSMTSPIQFAKDVAGVFSPTSVEAGLAAVGAGIRPDLTGPQGAQARNEGAAELMADLPAPIRPIVAGTANTLLPKAALLSRSISGQQQGQGLEGLNTALQQGFQATNPGTVGKLANTATNIATSLPFLANPAVAPVMLAAEGTESAITQNQAENEKRAAEGKPPLEAEQELLNIGGQAALNFLLGKLMPGQKINSAVLRRFGGGLAKATAGAIQRTLLQGGIQAGEGYAFSIANNVIRNLSGQDVPLTEGALENAGVQGVTGAAIHGLRETQGEGVPPPKAVSAPAEKPAPTETTKFPKLPGETDEQWNERRALTLSALTEKAQYDEMGTKAPGFGTETLPEPPKGSPLEQHINEKLGLPKEEPVSTPEGTPAADESPKRPGGAMRERVGSPGWESSMQQDDPAVWKLWASELGTGTEALKAQLARLPAAEVDAARSRLLEMYSKEGSEPPPVFKPAPKQRTATEEHAYKMARKGITLDEEDLAAMPEHARAAYEEGLADNAKGPKPVDEALTEGDAKMAKEAVQAKAQTATKLVQSVPPPPIVPPTEANAKAPGALKRGWMTAKKGIENLITRIDYQIRDISPRVFGRLSEYQFRAGEASERFNRPLRKGISDLSRDIRKRSPADQAAFDKAYLDNDVEAMKKLAPEHAETIDAWRTLLDTLYDAEKTAGIDVGHTQDYLPRTVRDVEGYLKALGTDRSKYEAAIADAAKQQGRSVSSFSPEEKADVINSVINGFGPKVPGKKGLPFVRSRRIGAVEPEHVKFYDTFENSIPQYINKASQAIARADFLGKAGTPESVDQSVGRILQEEVDAGHLSKEAQDQVHALLTTRLLGEMNHMGSTMRGIRTVGYLTGLGQFRNAIANLTDAATTFVSYGGKATLKGIRQAVGLEPGRKHEDIGIHSYGEEYKNRGQIDKATEKVLSHTGFGRLDRLGKEIRQNAARDFMARAAKNPSSRQARSLRSQYEEVLGQPRFDQAMADLAAGKTTQDVGYLEWLETTKTQPVGLNQMPPQYLKMNNGRILYQMKVFTLTQLDSMRREVLQKIQTPGQRKEGIAALGRLLTIGTLAGASKELVADLLRGKPINPDQIPERMLNGILTWVGLSTFDLKKAWADPMEWAIDWWASPAAIFRSGIHDVKTAGGVAPAKGQPSGSQLVRHIPLIGDLLYYWTPIGMGYHKTKKDAASEYKRKMTELRDSARDAVVARDFATANQAIAGYNEARRRAPLDMKTRKTPLTIQNLVSQED